MGTGAISQGKSGWGMALTTHPYLVKVKVKESCNRPGVTQRVPGGLGSQISTTFGT